MQVNLLNKKKQKPSSIEEKVKKIIPDAYGPVQNPLQQENKTNVYLEGATKLKENPSNMDTIKNIPQSVNKDNAYEEVPSYKEKNSNIYSKDAYNQYNKKVEDGYSAYRNLVNSQVAGATSGLERNRRSIENSYNEAYKSLVKDKENNVNNLPETMAKLGLYGSGAGETAVANITAEYGNQLKSLMKAKNDALYDLDGQIEKVKQQGAEQIASYYSNMMQTQPDVFLSFLDKQFEESVYKDKRSDVVRSQKIEDAGISADLGDYNPYAEQGYISSDRAGKLNNIVASSEENSEYNSKLNKALISAQYGDFQPLVDLGVIPSERAEELKNILASSEGDSEYNSKLNKALTSAQYGNFQPLVDLGVIPSERANELTNNYKAEENYNLYQINIAKALNSAQFGDYSGLADLGVITPERAEELKNILANSEEDSEFNRNLQKALASAQYGDYSGLADLGVITPERATELTNNQKGRENYESYQMKFAVAANSAQYGDFQGLVDMGVITQERATELKNVLSSSEGDSEYNSKLNKALTSAQYGNFQPLVDLGLITSEHAGKLNQAWQSDISLTGGSTKKISTSSNSSDKEKTKNLVEADISHWLYSTKGMNLETGDVTDDYFYSGWNENTNPVYAARDKLKDPNAIRFIKDKLLEAGFSHKETNALVAQYIKTNDEEVAYAEGKTK